MGVSGYARIADDYYPTPPWCTLALLKHFTPHTHVWEPACGQGHISRVLLETGIVEYSSDLVDRGYGEPEIDFLKTTAPPNPAIRSIITNPPYSGDLPQQFIKHSLTLMGPVKGSVAMLLRNEYDSASGRSDLFLHPAFALKLVLTKRPKWIEGSTGSPRHNYSWFVWDYETVGKPPTMIWGQ
jgi:hypothetical protein